MKSKTLLIINIILVYSITFPFSLTFNLGNNNDSKVFNNFTMDNITLRTSNITSPIHIKGNSGWVNFKNAGGCIGNGTYSDPYIIEDLIIDGYWNYNCVLVENSNVYFKIENCTLRYGRSEGWWLEDGAGIYLINVINAQLINNSFYSNNCGIILLYSNYSIISGNIVRDSTSSDSGISLSHSNDNYISRNILRNNEGVALYLSRSNNNLILENSLILDRYMWYTSTLLYLRLSNNNSIIGNTFINHYDSCWVERDCEGNVFINNYCNLYVNALARINIFIFCLISIISIISIIKLTTKRKR
ncbi:MAG: right-handed parallel beta-helix repeat-containing protein [Candidatus Thorarchaeota archaeon]